MTAINGESEANVAEVSTASKLSDLISRADTLLSELEIFQKRLHAIRPEGTFAFSKFRHAVQSERNVLERGATNPEGVSSSNLARGSNLPFHESVWNVAKNSKDVLALPLWKRWLRQGTGIDLVHGIQRLHLRENSRAYAGQKVPIDVICDAGKTWKKLSLATNKSLLFDLAKQGWQSDESGSDDSPYKNDPDDDDSDVPLLKTTKALVKAANDTRVLTQHPTVHIILPRLERGQISAVDAVLQAMERCGALVLCKADWEPAPHINDALPTMVQDPLLKLTETLNIDCTILLALVSDLSHTQIDQQAWFHDQVRRQVEREADDLLLPSTLYPILAGRELVCTKEAAEQMRSIVSTMGTASEQTRSAILLGDSSTLPSTCIEDFQRHSSYPVPSQLQLPLKVIEQSNSDHLSRLRDDLSAAGAELSAINQAVFMFGWIAGYTTITSNRAAVKQIEHGLEKLEDIDETLFPSIWVCNVARSLVGKEKKRGSGRFEKS